MRYEPWEHLGQQIWAELHDQAPRYFGGCPQYVVLEQQAAETPQSLKP